ncbi:MAG: DUF4340 domain-containing protein [Betaproteobacteria bacterium]
MNARVAAILVLLLAVLGGGALLYYQEERGRRPQNIDTLGRPLFKELRVADVAAIRIVEPKGELTVQRRDEGWSIAERGGFPADLARVREFVLKLAALKVGQSEPIGEKDRARLNLDASGTRVELGNAEGKPLAQLTVGKRYWKREPDNPERTPADGRFVGLPAEPGQAYLVSDALTQASTRSADWIDRSSFKVEKVKALAVRYPDGSGYRIERAGDNADWRMDGLPPGTKVDTGRANAASYSLSLLELADVAPKDAADTGLDKPILVDATTLAGRAYAIKVGRLEGDNHYVSFQATGGEAGGQGEPREKMLAQHVLLIPKAKLADTLKKRSELVEKKEDTKK